MITKHEEISIANKLMSPHGFADMIKEARPLALLMCIRYGVVHAQLTSLDYKRDHEGLTSEEKKAYKALSKDQDLMHRYQPIPKNEDEAHPDTVKWLRERAYLLPNMTRHWIKEQGLKLG